MEAAAKQTYRRSISRTKTISHWLLLLLTLVTVFFTPSAYTDQGKTILVLDASGSMWQKISDGYKIKIAQQVVGDLLQTIPADQEIGLITYGHRRKGDCSDIELLVDPAADTRDQIASAVNALDPKGKTPLSAAVIEAADVLRIEENEATVILVSDGLETCNLDPCLVGTELEQRGINFTTHVIGFDVDESEERAQLQCLAENTGGKFLTASNAIELAEALATVSQVEPETSTLTVVAEDEDGTLLRDGLFWTLVENSSDSTAELKVNPNLVDNLATPRLSTELESGNYTITVTRDADQEQASLDVNIGNSPSNQFKLILPVLLPEASVRSVESVIIGDEFSVHWQGPAESGDLITIARTGDLATESVERRSTLSANPAIMSAPTEPGEYEIRYVYAAKARTIASAKLVVEDSPANLEAPAESPLATSISIEWHGPDQNLDYIAVGKPGELEHLNLTRTSKGSPLRLQMPPETGEYELRYVLYQDTKVLTTRPITVTEADVSIQAENTAALGSRAEVSWVGPDENLDYIAIAAVGEDKTINLTRTSTGDPLVLEMPTSAGEFEIRYISYRTQSVLATKPVTVTDVSVSLNAPQTASLGQSVKVEWDGPDQNLDYIAVGKPNEPGYINYTYTGHGNPSTVQMPAEPGEYEIRYVLYQDKKVLATHPITVEPVNVTLEAPDSAELGASIKVTWEGPNENLDYIAIGKPGEPGYINYSYTDHGNPSTVLMPAEPGEYEIRYVLYQGKKVLATRTITVEEVAVTLNAATQASIGDSLTVEWQGPDARNDYIDVADPESGEYINYAYTREGSPLKLQMPSKPGNYEIRYVLGQDRTVLASHLITVEEVAVTLQAATRANIGDSITVEWQGPDASNDYIDIADPDTGRYINYSYTRDGSPLKLQMPPESGNYEIRYILGQDRTVLATHSITVEEVAVTLQAAALASIGDSVVVEWRGPDARNDYIDIADPETGNYINYSYTRDGSPLILQMPAEPGNYEIRYVLGQDRTVLATKSITIEAVEVSLGFEEVVNISSADNAQKLPVDWVGPDARNDYIQITKAGSERALNRVYTKAGSPALLKLPSDSGTYEISYVLGQGTKILESRKLEVVLE